MGVLTEISLFSGYGGFSLGLQLAEVPCQTVCYVECDKFCIELLKQRILDGFLNDAPIWDDVTTFDGRPWCGQVDIVTAGFPCQPHSNAGKRLGKEDSRNLWPDTCRIIREVGPRYVLLENVRGLADGANPFAAEVLGSLSEAGYDAVWGLHSAAEAGAPHLRWRWWCLAYTKFESGQVRGHDTSDEIAGRLGSVDCPRSGRNDRWQSHTSTNETIQSKGSGGSGRGDEDVADSESRRQSSQGLHCGSWWSTEPDVGRVADGVAHRVDRLRALGNGIVPAVVAEFLRDIGGP